MSYWIFHLVFMLPVIGVLFYLNRRSGAQVFPATGWGFAVIVAIALVYTTPWDNYLVWRGVWSYTNDRITESLRIGWVPLEEYCFFILMPLLTGQYLLFFARRHAGDLVDWTVRTTPGWSVRLGGAAFFLVIALLGVLSLWSGGRWTYLGLILVWACPVLIGQWIYGGDHLWRAGKVYRATAIASTAYLWVVDWIAIDWQIWHISPEFSSGWNLIGLPFEEAVFFLITNLLIIQGLLLFYEFVITRRRKALV